MGSIRSIVFDLLVISGVFCVGFGASGKVSLLQLQVDWFNLRDNHHTYGV